MMRRLQGVFALLAVAVLSHILEQFLAVPGLQLAALSGFSGLATYDMANAGPLSLSNELSAVLLADTQLLGRIAVRGEATQVDHYWLEESLNATYVELNEDLDASETGVDVVSATGVQVGALLMDETLGKQEVMQVTAISGTTLTVTRGAGDSGPSAETHSSGARLRIIGRPKPEGDENVTDESKARDRRSNICQIFKKEVKVSGTQQAVDLIGVPNEYAHQLTQRMLEIKRELAMSVYAGVKISAGGAGGSDSVYRSFDGLRNRTRQQSSQLVTTSEALTEKVVNHLYHLIYDKGAEANFACSTRDQMVAFSEMYKEHIRYSPSDRARGVYVTKFLTDLGVEIDLITDRWAMPGDLLMGDISKASLVPLRGRQLQAKPLKESGDALIGMIVGEYTLEQRHAPEAWALHTGLQARS